MSEEETEWKQNHNHWQYWREGIKKAAVTKETTKVHKTT